MILVQNIMKSWIIHLCLRTIIIITIRLFFLIIAPSSKKLRTIQVHIFCYQLSQLKNSQQTNQAIFLQINPVSYCKHLLLHNSTKMKTSSVQKKTTCYRHQISLSPPTLHLSIWSHCPSTYKMPHKWNTSNFIRRIRPIIRRKLSEEGILSKKLVSFLQGAVGSHKLLWVGNRKNLCKCILRSKKLHAARLL